MRAGLCLNICLFPKHLAASVSAAVSSRLETGYRCQRVRVAVPRKTRCSKHIVAEFFTGFIIFATKPLPLEQVEEAFHDSIFPAVRATAHADGQIVLFKELLQRILGGLEALVCCLSWFACKP
jgi:hypothetical protein